VGPTGGVGLARTDHGTHGICLTLPSVMGWTANSALSAVQAIVEGVAFITQAVQIVSMVGGLLRDVQALAGHASLSTTSRYIETNSEGSKISGYPLIGEMAS
jgi:hypothetical protein